MKSRPPEAFAGVPLDGAGQPLLVARDEASFHFYLHWLADYLHRPSPRLPVTARLSFEQARSRVLALESEVAGWLWAHPFSNYPPDDGPARHADLPQRQELSRILSRVEHHGERHALLYHYYAELDRDAHK